MNDRIRKEIITFSLDWFAKTIDKRLTVTEICSNLHISKTAFYERFDNIQELYDCLFDNRFEIFVNELNRSVDLTSDNMKRNVDIYVHTLLLLLYKYKTETEAFLFYYKEMFLVLIQKKVHRFIKFEKRDKKYIASQFLIGGFHQVIESWLNDSSIETLPLYEKILSEQLFNFITEYNLLDSFRTDPKEQNT